MCISSSCNFLVYHSPESKLDLFGMLPEDGPLNHNDAQFSHTALLMTGNANLDSAKTEWATDVASVLAEWLSFKHSLKKLDTHYPSVGRGSKCETDNIKLKYFEKQTLKWCAFIYLFIFCIISSTYLNTQNTSQKATNSWPHKLECIIFHCRLR